jgi:integrase
MRRTTTSTDARGRTGKRYHRALEQARRWGAIPRNPLDMVDRPKVQPNRFQVYNASQVRILLEAIRGDRLEALYVLAVTAGMRQGELFALKWQDVDFVAGSLAVRRSVHDSNREFHETEPKSAAGRRKINLPEMALVALRSRSVMAEDEGLQECELIFPDRCGSYLRKSNFIRRSFLPLHALRFATNPVSRSAPYVGLIATGSKRPSKDRPGALRALQRKPHAQYLLPSAAVDGP